MSKHKKYIEELLDDSLDFMQDFILFHCTARHGDVMIVSLFHKTVFSTRCAAEFTDGNVIK